MNPYRIVTSLAAAALAVATVGSGTSAAVTDSTALVVHTDKGAVRGVRTNGVDSFLA